MNKREHLKQLLGNKSDFCTLADVMLCSCDITHIDVHIWYGGFFSDTDGKLLCIWDTEHDDIDCQSEETIDFVYNLIVNRKVEPIIITDLKILMDFDLHIQKLAMTAKLIEQNICPDCGNKLENISNWKECRICGFIA